MTPVTHVRGHRRHVGFCQPLVNHILSVFSLDTAEAIQNAALSDPSTVNIVNDDMQQHPYVTLLNGP